MGKVKNITAVERAPFASSQVDRELGHIDGVLICGVQSRNGRDYPPHVLARDFLRYEGAVVNADHGDESTVARRLGWITNVKPGADGRPRGRLNVLKSHPLADAVFEAAERNPGLFGMSHVAVCSTKRINGRETVESINRVLSIDLVADPATTKSLYESHHTTEQPMKLRTYCEQVAAKWPAVSARMKVLSEMDGMGDVEMVDAPPMDVGPDDPVKAAFSQAMHALIDQFDSGAVDGQGLLSKLKQLMKAAEKMADEPAEKASPAEDAGEKAADMESVRKQLADVIKENAQLKLSALIGDTKLTDVQRKAVEALADDADRKALIESFKPVVHGQKPKSGEQNAVRLQPQQTTTGSIPTDGKAFAESLKRFK